MENGLLDPLFRIVQLDQNVEISRNVTFWREPDFHVWIQLQVSGVVEKEIHVFDDVQRQLIHEMREQIPIPVIDRLGTINLRQIIHDVDHDQIVVVDQFSDFLMQGLIPLLPGRGPVLDVIQSLLFQIDPTDYLQLDRELVV